MMLTLAPRSQIAAGKRWHPIEIGMTGFPGSPIFSCRDGKSTVELQAQYNIRLHCEYEQG